MATAAVPMCSINASSLFQEDTQLPDASQALRESQSLHDLAQLQKRQKGLFSWQQFILNHYSMKPSAGAEPSGVGVRLPGSTRPWPRFLHRNSCIPARPLATSTRPMRLQNASSSACPPAKSCDDAQCNCSPPTDRCPSSNPPLPANSPVYILGMTFHSME